MTRSGSVQRRRAGMRSSTIPVLWIAFCRRRSACHSCGPRWNVCAVHLHAPCHVAPQTVDVLRAGRGDDWCIQLRQRDACGAQQAPQPGLRCRVRAAGERWSTPGEAAATRADGANSSSSASWSTVTSRLWMLRPNSASTSTKASQVQRGVEDGPGRWRDPDATDAERKEHSHALAHPHVRGRRPGGRSVAAVTMVRGGPAVRDQSATAEAWLTAAPGPTYSEAARSRCARRQRPGGAADHAGCRLLPRPHRIRRRTVR